MSRGSRLPHPGCIVLLLLAFVLAFALDRCQTPSPGVGQRLHDARPAHATEAR